MVSFHLSISSKVEKSTFIFCFEVVAENDTYVIHCLIECYHTLLFIWHVLDYFVNIQFWNAKFQDKNEKNVSCLLVPNLKKSGGTSGGQKSDLVKHLEREIHRLNMVSKAPCTKDRKIAFTQEIRLYTR